MKAEELIDLKELLVKSLGKREREVQMVDVELELKQKQDQHSQVEDGLVD